MDEENDGERKEPGENDKEAEDDVDLYGDLETVGSDANNANNNVINRFNKMFSPKNRITEDDVGTDDNGEELEDDVGLYDDLNTFEKQLKAEELEAKIELLEQKLSHLDQQNSQLKSELEKVNKANLALRRNISSLYKTAKAESERKDRQLKELQRSYDTLVFRRGGSKAPPPAAVAAAETPNGHQYPVLQNDAANKKLVTLEDSTDCTVQMGQVSISFAVESSDFQKRRLERLEAESQRPDKEEVPSVAKASEQREKDRPPVKETSSHRPNKDAVHNDTARTNGHKVHPSETSENLEDGEVLEEAAAPPVEPKTKRPTEPIRRRGSRSPPPAKRKRSPSLEQRHLRDRPGGPPTVANRRPQRSPIKSSSHRNDRNGTFDRRSSRSNPNRR